MDGDSNYAKFQNPASPYGASKDPGDGYAPYQSPSSSGGGGTPSPATQVSPTLETQPADAGAKQKQPANPVAGFGNGINLQPSYDFGGDVDLGWSFLKNSTKVKTVRVEIEPDRVTQAKRWIAEAIGQGYAVIATYHKSGVLGTDVDNELQLAADWWVKYYKALAGSGYFTVNLMNEWGSHTIAASKFATSYNTAIAKVRAVYSGPIIVDLPGWGQETSIAADAVSGKGGGTKISDPNIILSAHLYPEAWNQTAQRGVNTADLDAIAATRRPCMIGEFGDSKKKQDTDWGALVNYAKTLNWPVLGWAFNGDSTPNPMNMIIQVTPLMDNGRKPNFLPFVKGKPRKEYQLTPYFQTIDSYL